MALTNYEAKFKLYKNGKDTERTITVYGATKEALKISVGHLANDYPEKEGYKLKLIES